MKIEMNEGASQLGRTIVVATAWVIILAGWPRISRRVRS